LKKQLMMRMAGNERIGSLLNLLPATSALVVSIKQATDQRPVPTAYGSLLWLVTNTSLFEDKQFYQLRLGQSGNFGGM